jgi:hypothetical protein
METTYDLIRDFGKYARNRIENSVTTSSLDYCLLDLSDAFMKMNKSCRKKFVGDFNTFVIQNRVDAVMNHLK